MRQLLHRELVHVVLVHELHDVDLPRLVEVEQRRREPLVDMQQREQPLLQLEIHQILLRLHLGIEIGRHGGEEARQLDRLRQLRNLGGELRRRGRHLAKLRLAVHLAQETTREHHEDAAVTFPLARPLVHGYVVVARNEDALALADADTLASVVENHFARIHVIEGIFARAMRARLRIVVKETEKHIVVVEYQLHRLRSVRNCPIHTTK